MARRTDRTKKMPLLVASSRTTFAGAATQTVKIKLTTAGRRLLKHAARLKLTTKATFFPPRRTPRHDVSNPAAEPVAPTRFLGTLSR
jgi:hypothetical protein